MLWALFNSFTNSARPHQVLWTWPRAIMLPSWATDYLRGYRLLTSVKYSSNKVVISSYRRFQTELLREGFETTSLMSVHKCTWCHDHRTKRDISWVTHSRYYARCYRHRSCDNSVKDGLSDTNHVMGAVHNSFTNLARPHQVYGNQATYYYITVSWATDYSRGYRLLTSV